MNEINMLAKQTEDAYQWVDKLVSSIPYTQWDTLPDVVESTVSWQAGHLIVSYYFHTIMVIKGHQPELFKQMPLMNYSSFYTDAMPKESAGKTTPEELHRHLLQMGKNSLEMIQSLTVDDLKSPLAPGPIQHPIAKTKQEALDWNIKHTMWHCGQIGMLKRITGERYSFGLKKGA